MHEVNEWDRDEKREKKNKKTDGGRAQQQQQFKWEREFIF